MGEIEPLALIGRDPRFIGRRRGFRLKHVLVLSLTCSLVVVWALFFRPQMFGGPISNIAVSGNSMLPTFESGDFLIVKREDSYVVGDIVVYSIPADQVGAGRRVVHRIVGGDENGFELKGDNNANVDPWRPTQDQIIGQEWFRIPSLARLLSYLRNPAILAIAIAFMTLAVLLSPGSLRSKMWVWLRK